MSAVRAAPISELAGLRIQLAERQGGGLLAAFWDGTLMDRILAAQRGGVNRIRRGGRWLLVRIWGSEWRFDEGEEGVCAGQGASAS